MIFSNLQIIEIINFYHFNPIFLTNVDGNVYFKNINNLPYLVLFFCVLLNVLFNGILLFFYNLISGIGGLDDTIFL